MKKFVSLSVLLLACMSAYADVTLSGLFMDHMVLQRDVPVAIYGRAEPGEQVTVSFPGRTSAGQAGQEKSTVADKAGNWSVKLDALKVSTNSMTMTIAGKNKLTLNDVVIGDVWVCSGQSNMEWMLGQSKRTNDINEANFPLLRQFIVPKCKASSAQSETKSRWEVCEPRTAGNFTAAGFYFARKIQWETGIPIGLIKSAWGGTCIEPWTTYEGLAAVPELAAEKSKFELQLLEYHTNMGLTLARLETYVAETRNALGRNTELPEAVRMPEHPVLCSQPGWSSLYNGMIHPLVNYRIKGAIWYQGEANGYEGDIYMQKMRALIGGWRKAWNQGDFPFYFVQLANYQNPNNNPMDEGGWAKLRMAQNKSLSITNTGMAVAIDLADVGNPGDIHPKNKLDVGERLALWALARDYGQKQLVCSGPLFREMRIEEGKIRIFFDHTGSGLTVATKKGYEPMVKEPHGKLQKFAVAGENKKWVWAEAVIDGKSVVVSSPEVLKPVAVRYAFAMNPDGCNLYNNEGLPAAPFRTDVW